MSGDAAIKAAITVEPLPGIPATDLVVEAVVALVRPLIVGASLTIDDGPTLTDATFEAQLAEFLAERPSFTARGTGRTEMTVRWVDVVAPGLPRTGSLHTYKTVAVDEIDALVESMVAATRTLHAPWAYLDQFDHGFRDRVDRHRSIYQHDRTGAERVFGLLRGFTGIPWRTVLGPASVAFFGTDALASLPDNLARHIDDDYWLLTPGAHPSDWSPETYCDDERHIIEALGHEKFFDPDTGELPRVLPRLPDVASIAVTARERDAEGEWQWKSYGC